MTINWEEIEVEYITQKTTYRKLAEKYKISRSAIEKYAKENNWTKKRGQYWGKVKANALARTGAREVNRLVKLQQEADKMAEVLEKVIDDKKQFRRHVATGVDENGNVNIVEAVVDKYDMKAIKNYTAALKELSGVIRDIYEIYPEQIKQQMKLQKEKFEIEKEKLELLRKDKKDAENDEYGVIEIAEVIQPPDELKKEGKNNANESDMDTPT